MVCRQQQQQEMQAGVTAGTIFAYGQTGSGKTHTMMGTPEGEPGLIALSLSTIFEHIKSDSSRQYLLRLSVHEIYNGSLRGKRGTETAADVHVCCQRKSAICSLLRIRQT